MGGESSRQDREPQQIASENGSPRGQRPTASQVLAAFSILEVKRLVGANNRLPTAYLLKETFDRLWDYSRLGWAPRFFANWKDALKWLRQEPFRPGLEGRHFSPARRAGRRTKTNPFNLAQRASVGSTDASGE